MSKWVMLLFSFLALGQTNEKIPVIFSVGNSSQMGYVRPDLSFGAGFEKYSDNKWWHAGITVVPTDKYYYGNVTQVIFDGGIFRMTGSHFFMGGGAKLRNIQFHDLGSGRSYLIAGPVLGAGWLGYENNLRIYLRCYPYSYDRRYDSVSANIAITYDIRNRFRVGSEYYFLRSKAKFGTNYYNAFSSKFLFGILF